MIILNNPFDFINKAVKELYGDVKCEIQFVTDLKDGYGVTIFPDDDSLPLIEIPLTLEFQYIPEILVHELAHVIAGEQEEHNEKWKSIFENIFDKSQEIMIKERSEYQSKNKN